jgi:hypothetical protein
MTRQPCGRPENAVNQNPSLPRQNQRADGAVEEAK